MADRVFVQHDQNDYAQALADLLPSGSAWPRDPDRVLMKVVAGLAGIWANPIDSSAADLLQVESDPRATLNMLPDWEKAFGLPDPCNDESQTIETRRAALLARMTTLGEQSIVFFEGVAADLGYTIKIYEYLPVACGRSICGDTRPNGEYTYKWAYCGVAQCGIDHMCDLVLNAGDDWIWRLGPPELRYIWRVSILNTRLTWLRGGVGVCGIDHMCEFGLATDLECLIRRWKPGHTTVIFDYSQVSIG